MIELIPVSVALRGVDVVKQYSETVEQLTTTEEELLKKIGAIKNGEHASVQG